MMTSRSWPILPILPMVLLLLSACGGGADTQTASSWQLDRQTLPPAGGQLALRLHGAAERASYRLDAGSSTALEQNPDGAWQALIRIPSNLNDDDSPATHRLQLQYTAADGTVHQTEERIQVEALRAPPALPAP